MWMQRLAHVPYCFKKCWCKKLNSLPYLSLFNTCVVEVTHQGHSRSNQNCTFKSSLLTKHHFWGHLVASDDQVNSLKKRTFAKSSFSALSSLEVEFGKCSCFESSKSAKKMQDFLCKNGRCLYVCILPQPLLRLGEPPILHAGRWYWSLHRMLAGSL